MALTPAQNLLIGGAIAYTGLTVVWIGLEIRRTLKATRILEAIYQTNTKYDAMVDRLQNDAEFLKIIRNNRDL